MWLVPDSPERAAAAAQPHAVLRPISRAAADAVLAGGLPPDVRVAADYPTEFSLGVVPNVGNGSPLGPYFIHRGEDDVVVGEIGGGFVGSGWSRSATPSSSPAGSGYATDAVCALVERARAVPAIDQVVPTRRSTGRRAGASWTRQASRSPARSTTSTRVSRSWSSGGSSASLTKRSAQRPRAGRRTGPVPKRASPNVARPRPPGSLPPGRPAVPHQGGELEALPGVPACQHDHSPAASRRRSARPATRSRSTPATPGPPARRSTGRRGRGPTTACSTAASGVRSRSSGASARSGRSMPTL